MNAPQTLEKTMNESGYRDPGMELRIMINELHRLSGMPKVSEPIRLRALSRVDEIETRDSSTA